MKKKNDKEKQLDDKLGQETEKLHDVPGGELASDKTTIPVKSKCVCCGLLKATPGFKYCFGCHKKWLAVHDDFANAGFSEEIARKRATKAYPPRYDPV